MTQATTLPFRPPPGFVPKPSSLFWLRQVKDSTIADTALLLARHLEDPEQLFLALCARAECDATKPQLSLRLMEEATALRAARLGEKPDVLAIRNWLGLARALLPASIPLGPVCFAAGFHHAILFVRRLSSWCVHLR